jgi:hypothetical protein
MEREITSVTNCQLGEREMNEINNAADSYPLEPRGETRTCEIFDLILICSSQAFTSFQFQCIFIFTTHNCATTHANVAKYKSSLVH